MELKIKITMDNAAFEEQLRGDEVARILFGYANRVAGETDIPDAVLRDSNGNKVGTAEVWD